MRFKKIAIAAAASLMAATSVQAAQAQTVDVARASASLEETNGQFGGGGSSDYLIGAVIVVALGLGLYFLVIEDDGQTSP